MYTTEAFNNYYDTRSGKVINKNSKSVKDPILEQSRAAASLITAHRTNLFNAYEGEYDENTFHRRFTDEILDQSGVDLKQVRLVYKAIDEIDDIKAISVRRIKKRLNEMKENILFLSAEQINFCARITHNIVELEDHFKDQARSIFNTAKWILGQYQIDYQSFKQGNRVMQPLEASFDIDPEHEAIARGTLLERQGSEPVQDLFSYKELLELDRVSIGLQTNFDSFATRVVNMLGYKTIEDFLSDINGKVILDLGSGCGALAKIVHVYGGKPKEIISINPGIDVMKWNGILRNKDRALWGSDLREHRSAFDHIHDKTKNLYWDEIDTKTLGIENQSVDMVLSEAAFPMYARTTTEVESTLKRIHQLLKPNGKIRLGPVYDSDTSRVQRLTRQHCLLERFSKVFVKSGFDQEDLDFLPGNPGQSVNKPKYIVLAKQSS